MTDRIDTAQEREKLAKLQGHTPGPWFAGRDYEDGPFVAGGGYCLINTVGPELDREPNARLIAAAPDLLGLAHRLLDALDAEQARAEKAEAERDTAWNDAIEAAKDCVDGNHPLSVVKEMDLLKKGDSHDQ